MVRLIFGLVRFNRDAVGFQTEYALHAGDLLEDAHLLDPSFLFFYADTLHVELQMAKYGCARELKRLAYLFFGEYLLCVECFQAVLQGQVTASHCLLEVLASALAAEQVEREPKDVREGCN